MVSTYAPAANVVGPTAPPSMFCEKTVPFGPVNDHEQLQLFVVRWNYARVPYEAIESVY
jgi:hypothetical protein